MKKLIAFSAAAALLCAFTACSSGKESSITMNEAKTSDDGKTIITVGNFGFYDSAFSDTLGFPQEFKVESRNYMKGDISFDDAARQLDLDMIQGDAPDVLFAPPDKLYNYIRKGAMADMYELMDEYGGLEREDFLPNVLEGLTINGELPAVVDSFFISTAVAKTKYVGEEFTNWTPEQAMQFYSEMPEGMDFLGDEDRSLSFYMLRNPGKGCIDYTDYTCDFSGGSFTDTLRFCAEHPFVEGYVPDISTMPEEEMLEYFGGTKGTDRQLVYRIDISGFNHSLANDAYANLSREDFTFVGLPSSDGNGAKTYTNNISSQPYGILKNSSSKEAAWKLVTQLLRYRKPLEKFAWDDTLGIPVLVSQFNIDYDRSSSYHNSINCDLYPPGEWEEEKAFRITDEVKEKLRDYIFSVKFDIYYPDELSYFIDEECDPVIAGERTPEEAVRILDDRITTFLSERS